MSLDFPFKFLSCVICLMILDYNRLVFGSHIFHSFDFSGGVMIYIDRIEVVNMLAPCAGMVLISSVVFMVMIRIFITERSPEE